MLLSGETPVEWVGDMGGMPRMGGMMPDMGMGMSVFELCMFVLQNKMIALSLYSCRIFNYVFVNLFIWLGRRLILVLAYY